MLHLIHSRIERPKTALPRVALRVDRMRLAKRLWRAVADDGEEFGFELEKPLQPGDVVFQTDKTRYVIEQELEAVLEISLDVAPSAAAGIGWAIGNVHLELMAEPTRLLALDEKAVRQLLARLAVPFSETTAVFRPGHFARGKQNQIAQIDELGPSHKH